MKRILICVIALALGLTASAQYGPGRPGGRPGSRPGGNYSHSYSPGGGYRPRSGYYGYDGVFEFGITLNHFTTGQKDGYKPYRPDRVGFFGEYRVEISPVVEMGLQLSTTFGKGSLMVSGSVNPYGDDMWYWQGAPLIVTDINLLPYSGFNPYFGIGIGPGFGYEKDILTKDHNWTQALVISPRIGVELFECLRMSVQYQWYLSGAYTYSHASFGISWAFGEGMRGRPRMR